LEQESKEKEKKIPEFEERNHREPSDDTWEKKIEKAYIWNGERYKLKDIEVRINTEGDIKEYVS